MSLVVLPPVSIAPMSCLSEKTSTIGDVSDIREVIIAFLKGCDVTFPNVAYEHEFDATCREEARQRGYPVEGPHSLARFIPGGVVMATTAYAHLQNKSTQLFISLYTAFLIYLDDVFQYDIEAVRDFNERFMLQQSQADPVLDCFAGLLLDLPKHFNRVVSNLIITSTLNLVTALSLEYETQGMPVQSGAHGYPTFTRLISGASEAYALFVFPRELALPSFIQSLPEMMIYINNGNDILSFYKEELAEESVNRVSILASLHRTSKYEALWRLTDDAIDAHNRVIQILKAQPGAFEAYMKFAQGYIGFHSGLPRYRLSELKLRSA